MTALLMQDYSITKCTRKCAASGRDLQPGESYVSAILPDGDALQRVDIADSEWRGPQPETIGWWRSRMPESHSGRRRPAPSGVLLDTLSSLLERPGKESLAYVLALLLVRRRVLVEEETLEHAEQEGCWRLICSADQRTWNVPLCQPSASEFPELHRELDALLFTEE